MAARTYALVIGVSRYDHLPASARPEDTKTFGLQQLHCAALSAAAFHRWLKSTYRRPEAQLAPPRLLLSPSATEKTKLQAAEKKAKPATAANVEAALEAWRADCEKDRDNVAIFYAAGHGAVISTLEGGTLLLQDFAASPNKPLENALNVAHVRAAMVGPAGPRRQFYFLDACQNRPDLAATHDVRAARLPGWMGSHVNSADTSPIYHSAAQETKAYGRKGQPTFFSQALIDCLDRWGVEPPGQDGRWSVVDVRLGAALHRRVTEIAAESNVVQRPQSGGEATGEAFHYPDKLPAFPVTVSVSPERATAVARCTLKRGSAVVYEAQRVPKRQEVEVGGYTLSVAIDPPTPGLVGRTDSLFVLPNGHDHNRVVSVV